MLLDHLEKIRNGKMKEKWSFPDTREILPFLERIVIGGSQPPTSLVEVLKQDYGINIFLSWGMTEISPCGVVGSLKRSMSRNGEDEKYLLKPGRIMYGVDMKVVHDVDEEADVDADKNMQRPGRLMVKGPWVISRYWNADSDAVDTDGWFDTGDVAKIDNEGYLDIVDRSKDVIKSGGEWISSLALENASAANSAVDSSAGPGTAAIAVSHPKWGERPIREFP